MSFLSPRSYNQRPPSPPNPNSTAHTIFPTYLLPSIPFRRRQSSTSTTTVSAGSSPPDSAPTPFPTSKQPSYLSGHKSHLRCSRCSTDLALTSQIISKGFTGRHGRAYLVSGSQTPTAISPTSTSLSTVPALPNTHAHKPVPRQLVTGAHTVSDISCIFCGSVLGWQYVAAEEESQRYKVGKFILETKKVVACSSWENHELPPNRMDTESRGLDSVEFDSQDEDECEDLFAGIWSPALAERRRRGRTFLRRTAMGERAKSEDGHETAI